MVLYCFCGTGVVDGREEYSSRRDQLSTLLCPLENVVSYGYI